VTRKYRVKFYHTADLSAELMSLPEYADYYSVLLGNHVESNVRVYAAPSL